MYGILFKFEVEPIQGHRVWDLAHTFRDLSSNTGRLRNDLSTKAKGSRLNLLRYRQT